MIQIVTDIHSSRLIYVLDFVFNQVLKTGYQVCKAEEIHPENPVINYTGVSHNTLSFRPSKIMSDSHCARPEDIDSIVDDLKRWISECKLSHETDIFGIIFCYLSRYEEYLEKPINPGKRFLATSSLFYHLSPEEPVVDKLIHEIKDLIQDRYHSYTFSSYTCTEVQSTIDIDQAWAHQYKGWRNILTFFKALFNGDFSRINTIFNVLIKKEKDPFDTYDYIINLHKSVGLLPVFFILLSDKLTIIDRNHHPDNQQFKKLIKKLSEKHPTGIHPSYHSHKSIEILRKEIRTLEDITSKKVTCSRQHFLMMQLPDTYRNLLSLGITDDFTMGFPDRTGFRAGTGNSFLWYDLLNETTTTLMIHPFQVMDVTLLRYMKLTPDKAKLKIQKLRATAIKYNIPFPILWHNSSLVESGEWKGWRKVYESAIQPLKINKH